MKMLEMGAAERPREKMMHIGPDALSDGELLAVILRSGSAGENALDLSRRLLSEAGGNLTGLFSMSVDRMMAMKGLGPLKALSVKAALELGRRFASEGSGLRHKPVTSPDIAYDLLRSSFKGIRHEECWVIYLNNAHYVLGKSRISSGSSDQTSMDIRQILRLALDKTASAIILAHNHPSGNPHPSEADIHFTGQLHDAAGPFGISLLDHLIVCDDCYYSFSEDEMRYRKQKVWQE